MEKLFNCPTCNKEVQGVISANASDKPFSSALDDSFKFYLINCETCDSVLSGIALKEQRAFSDAFSSAFA